MMVQTGGLIYALVAMLVRSFVHIVTVAKYTVPEAAHRKCGERAYGRLADATKQATVVVAFMQSAVAAIENDTGA